MWVSGSSRFYPPPPPCTVCVTLSKTNQLYRHLWNRWTDCSLCFCVLCFNVLFLFSPPRLIYTVTSCTIACHTYFSSGRLMQVEIIAHVWIVSSVYFELNVICTDSYLYWLLKGFTQNLRLSDATKILKVVWLVYESRSNLFLKSSYKAQAQIHPNLLNFINWLCHLSALTYLQSNRKILT